MSSIPMPENAGVHGTDGSFLWVGHVKTKRGKKFAVTVCEEMLSEDEQVAHLHAPQVKWLRDKCDDFLNGRGDA